MKVGGSGKEFFPKNQKFRQWLWGVHSDIGPEFYAAERITSDALSKCRLLPEVFLALLSPNMYILIP
jgi:hypothetical protein